MSQIPPSLPEPKFPPLEQDGPIDIRLSEDDFDFLQKQAEKVPLLPHGNSIQTPQKIFSGLVSGIVNIVLLIFLALVFLQGQIKPVVINAVFSEGEGDQLEIETLDEGNLDPNPAETYILPQPDAGDLSDFAVPENLEPDMTQESLDILSEASRTEITDLFEGRTDPGKKNDLLSKYGGNEKTSDAVKKGLLWLKKNQNREGSWSLLGPYKDGIHQEDNLTAATGLALLAFQGDGNTRYEGEYQLVVKKAWKWLLQQQGDDGSFFNTGNTNGRFYTQAVCTIALCELVAMEKRNGKGKDLLGDAQRAVDYLVDRQNMRLGGWRYSVDSKEQRIQVDKKRTKLVVVEESVESDLSVTGWCTMALMSARAAELNVPDETFERIGHFLDTVSENNGAEYKYNAFGGVKPSMTATGLLCREYLGWDRRNPALLLGAATLVTEDNLVRYPNHSDDEKMSLTNVYGWYSASMMLKHLGAHHSYWKKWNAVLRQEVPEHQEPEGSPEAGSWDPKHDDYYFGGGRLYVTCLSLLCLEVYYRHLSLYE